MQTTTTPLTIHHLTVAGFSRDEIKRLAALRAGYNPYREYCASNAEYERLNFLKWRYEQGEIREAITG